MTATAGVRVTHVSAQMSAYHHPERGGRTGGGGGGDRGIATEKMMSQLIEEVRESMVRLSYSVLIAKGVTHIHDTQFPPSLNRTWQKISKIRPIFSLPHSLAQKDIE